MTTQTVPQATRHITLIRVDKCIEHARRARAIAELLRVARIDEMDVENIEIAAWIIKGELYELEVALEASEPEKQQ